MYKLFQLWTRRNLAAYCAGLLIFVVYSSHANSAFLDKSEASLLSVKDMSIPSFVDKENENLESTDAVVPDSGLTIGDGNLIDQTKDDSFTESADPNLLVPDSLFIPTASMLVQGIVVDETGNPIGGVKVTINGRSVTTLTSGRGKGVFWRWVPLDDFVVLRLRGDGYADVIDKFSSEGLVVRRRGRTFTPALPQGKIGSSARLRRIKMLRYGAQSIPSIDLRYGSRTVETKDGASLTFPKRDSSHTPVPPFDVGLTSMHFSRNTPEFYKLRQFKGKAFSLGERALQLFGVIDVVIHDHGSGKRVDLEKYDMEIEVRMPTSCNNKRLAPIKAWYLDDSRLPPEQPVWLEHREKADFHNDGGRCYFSFNTNHFTKYAIAQELGLAFTALKVDASLLAISADHIYRIEVENSRGLLYQADINGSQLQGHLIKHLPANGTFIVRTKNLNTQKGSGVRLEAMQDFAGQERHIFLPELQTIAWTKNWLDFDDPSGNGDYELFQHWGDSQCETPFDIKVRDKITELVYLSALGMPNEIKSFNRNAGFACVNTQQPSTQSCRDYEIKLLCPSENNQPDLAENLALSAEASAQSAFPGYSAAKINDGNTNTKVGGSYSWANAHTYGFNGRLPNWVQLDFGRNVSMSRVVLYTSKSYEIKDYDLQIWNGVSWITVAAQRGNTSTIITHNFSTRVGSKIRVLGRRGPDKQVIYVRVNELQVY